MGKVKNIIQSPLAMYDLTEGPSRDVTFAQSLPNESLRTFFKHAQDVLGRYYAAELKGALTVTSTNKGAEWTWAKFHDTDRVKKRFLDSFVAVYDLFAFKPDKVVEPVAGAQAEVKEKEEQLEVKEKVKKADRSTRLTEFRADAEAKVGAEIDSRMVSLTQDGTHDELTASLSSSRLYMNLTQTQQVKLMGFYDVKNVKIMVRRYGDSIVQREPVVDMDKFDAFCKVANGLLKPGDLLWILVGKFENTADLIRKKVADYGWRDKSVHLFYDWKICRNDTSG